MKRIVAILMLVTMLSVAIPLTSYSQEEGGASTEEKAKDKGEKAEKGEGGGD
ncbi:MAG: hypothetical protein Q8P24_19330 [Desulfobacterales bacterium]|nr:hypothetical protein [Desulfobacterales bacterium]